MTLDVIAPDEPEVFEIDGSRIAGLVLAAGTGSRFEDGNKLLAEIDDTPVVVRATRTLVDAGLDPVIVVVGHDGDRVRDRLSSLPVTTVENPDYDSGQSASVRVGIDALPGSVDAVVITLGDMPRIQPTTIELLVETYRTTRRGALAAADDGERGNPVLFDRRLFPALRRLTGDAGGRSVLRNADDAALVETSDPGVHQDIDTIEDLPD